MFLEVAFVSIWKWNGKVHVHCTGLCKRDLEIAFSIEIIRIILLHLNQRLTMTIFAR
jgi:hypothetical protein